jgi:hypothetical protein
MRAAWLVLLAGCVDSDLSGVERVEAIHLVDIDATGAGHYELAPRELPELEDLATLRGTRIAFVGRPHIDYSGDVDNVLCGSIDITPSDLDLRLAVENDVAIPRDQRSLAMVSAYHELQFVFARAEEVTGISREEFRAAAMPVFFEPVLADDSGRLDGKTNAFYEPCSDAFGLFRPSSAEGVALAFNAQVLAHELGHAYFQRTFFAADGDCTPDPANLDNPSFTGRFSTEEDIAGLNEGFADFFSFVLVGTTAVLNDTLGPGTFAGERALSPAIPNYVAFNGFAPECDQEFYCTGTELARSLYEGYVADGHDPRDPVARAALGREVVDALRLLPTAMRSYTDDSALGPVTFAQSQCRRTTGASSLAQFLRALLEQLPAARRPALCAALDRHFVLRFPESSRGACL